MAQLADELRGSVSRFSLPTYLESTDDDEEQRLQAMLQEALAAEAEAENAGMRVSGDVEASATAAAGSSDEFQDSTAGSVGVNV